MEDSAANPSWYNPVTPIEVTGTRINLYIKHAKGLHRLMNVQRTGTGLITGSFLQQGPVRPLSHTVKNIHFTYPPSGDYHQTVLLKDGSEIKIFHDRISKKEPGGAWKIIPLEEIDQSFLFPRKRYKTPSLDEYKKNPELRHHFVAVGFDVLSSFKNAKSSSLKKPEVIIDVTDRTPVLMTCNLSMAARKWDTTLYDQRARLLFRYKDESQCPFIYMDLCETGSEPL